MDLDFVKILEHFPFVEDLHTDNILHGYQRNDHQNLEDIVVFDQLDTENMNYLGNYIHLHIGKRIPDTKK